MRTVPLAGIRKASAIGIIVAIALPATLATYVGACVASLGGFARHLNDSQQLDEGSLIPVNETRLAQMAREYEFYMNRDHLPLNYTLSAYWNATFSSIQAHIVAGDAAIWTGMTLAMAAFNYNVSMREGNESERASATALVHRLVDGVSLLLAVPNGGVGPSHGGILARAVSPKTWNQTNPPIAGFDYAGGADNVDVFDGQGDYDDWLYIGYPSLDQYSGIIMGITCAAVLVNDTAVQARVKLLAAQIIEHFTRTNWNLVDGNARTTGQNFQWMPEHSGFWVLGTLFMGTVTDPATYLPLYHHWAHERGYASRAILATDLSMFTLFNYFSMNINWVILYAMATFETDPWLKARYEWVMTERLHPVVTNHRNAWFNLAYLHVTGREDSAIHRDIGDQLMRFDVERVAGDPNSTRLPERGLNATGNRYEGIVPASWPRITFGDWLAGQSMYPPAGLNLAAGLVLDAYLARPKTVEHYQSVDFLWQRSPWEEVTSSPARRQDSGLAFLLPYYMARWSGWLGGGA